MRWRRERRGMALPPLPGPADLPLATPEPARPRGDHDEVRITWIGHASFLIQAGPFNVLTDPVWSEYASPVQGTGPRRLVAPGLPFDALPPIDATLLSHDHYDHLDAPTVRRIANRFGDRVTWMTPLGYSDWLSRRGVETVRELDWWERTELAAYGTTLTITACPAQHWTRRRPLTRSRRLWSSFVLETGSGRRIFFAGDSGYCPAFTEIGQQLGPFDAALLPIGAYEPRWFMKPAHMDPDEAVRAWRDLGGQGHLVAMHWGTFILTDEPALEPPERTRHAWARDGGEAHELSILRHGETLILAPRGRAQP
jgi:N-acyl-phosphatidylethanolamine-hydrolysing phospholipase D